MIPTAFQVIKAGIKKINIMPMVVVMTIGIMINISTFAIAAEKTEVLSKSETAYLNKLAKDTWACIDHFTNSKTSMPFDSNYRPQTTNTTNVGLYMVSIVAADQLGYITSEEAKNKLLKILTILDQNDHYRGFFGNHLNTDGKTLKKPGLSAISDFNKLPAAFVIVRQAYPELKLADKLFNRIEWNWLWDRKKKHFCQGFDVNNGDTSYWGDGWFASDVRMATLIGVATGGLPVEAYLKMERHQGNQYGLTFYKPAWEYAGLFMHGFGGLFVDERPTDMGWSTANFAYAQMLFANEKDYQAWGWSACNMPDQGYTIDGLISEAVITPHASALVLDYYPRKVIENFKILERLGVRHPYVENGRSYEFGFWDSINLITNKIAPNYYTSLDQAMVFIALANYLKPNCIRDLFMQDPVIKKGLERIGYNQAVDWSRLMLYRQRDREALTEQQPFTYSRNELLIDNFETMDNDMGQPRSFELENAPADSVEIRVRNGQARGLYWHVNYDLERYKRANLFLKEKLSNMDARGFNAIGFTCKSRNDKNAPLNLRIKMTDGYGSRNVGFVENVNNEWQEVVYPFVMFRGIVADLSRLKTIEFCLERSPSEFPGQPLAVTKGELSIGKVKLIKLSKAQLADQVKAILNAKRLSIGLNDRLEGITKLSGWQLWRDSDASLKLGLTQDKVPTLNADYELTKKAKWVAWEKSIDIDLSKDFELSFDIKGQGENNVLEVKVIATSGEFYGIQLPEHTAFKQWTTIKLTRKDFGYLWGGDKKNQLERIKTFGFAVNGKPGVPSKGSVQIKNVRLKLNEKK